MENWRKYKKSIQEGPVKMNRSGGWETDPNQGGSGDLDANEPDISRPSPNKGEAPPREENPEDQFLMSEKDLDVLVHTYVGKRPSMSKLRKTVHFLVERYSKDPKVLEQLKKMKSMSVEEEDDLGVFTASGAFQATFNRDVYHFKNITPGVDGTAYGTVDFYPGDDGYYKPDSLAMYSHVHWYTTWYPWVHGKLKHRMRTYHNAHPEDLKFVTDDRNRSDVKFEDEEAFNSNIASKYIEFMLMLRATWYASTYVHELAHVFESVYIGLKTTDGMPTGSRHKNEVSAVKRELAFINSMEKGFIKDIFTNKSFPGFFFFF